jgi:hypothetical protein
MTSQNNFITIQEACIYTEKSDATIRRLIKRLAITNQKNKKKTSQNIIKIGQGKSFIYKISKEFLDLEFNLMTSHDYAKDDEMISQKGEDDYAMTNDDYAENEFLSILKEQLAVKDDQMKQQKEIIDKLLEELAQSRNQSNTLLKNIQDNLVPLIETQQKLLSKNDEVLDITPKSEEASKRKKFLGLF